ncbi:MAG TPA: cell division protein FtsZ [Phnomibacter sp.]|nr:cell division protein FtsZ [Phnomibacter sp.]
MPPQKSNIIKVLGFGGGGGNAVNHMYGQTIQNVDFIVCNTDAQALANSPVPNKIQLGPHLTSGLGAGANPNIGKQATEESLEEIRKMLEINTKMAFITAGMGGGTGTGGAPIVAKICKELGILTVGIVTTPFSFEGPRRMAQAQAGVDELKEHVDTLLVISNDKLRHQFGNLKMKDAFSKADDVLTTAARCITDVISTTGQINVDFSDVCTVMRDGGVAILGSAQVGGEDRALQAIEAATNSPLLNDNDIAGAKWILLNICSSSGEYEFTMDEVEVIQGYLRQLTGENTDVILGLGYDDTLEDKLSITLIATGFRHKDPFAKPAPKKEAPPKPIVLTLGVAGEEKKLEADVPATEEMEQPMPEVQVIEPLMPVMEEMEPEREMYTIPNFGFADEAPGDFAASQQEVAMVFELDVQAQEEVIDTTPVAEAPVEMEIPEMPMLPPPPVADEHMTPELMAFLHQHPPVEMEETSPTIELQIEAEMEAAAEAPVVHEEEAETLQPTLQQVPEPEEELLSLEGLVLSFEDTAPAAEAAAKAPAMKDALVAGGEGDMTEEELQKRRAQERMARLRNLSFNPLTIDNNNEFEETPAYQRRNLDLHNAIANVEDFYSRATVKTDENNQGSISTVNNFLHGEKPD